MNTVALEPMYGWNTIPWKKIERSVFKLQKRIYQAEQRGDVKKVRTLQRLMLKSWYAKLLAVRRVTQDNQGKKTAGIDGVKELTPPQRLEMAQKLRISNKAEPVRRVWIPKPGKDEKRPLGIPVMTDRALQALVKMAIEPQWEAKFEPNSYGFRPGRSCRDAIEAIFLGIRSKPKWVLDADIAKCFDRIEQSKLLRKINASPTLTRQIKEWLKAGVIDKGELFPTETGTPQGGVISPLLANIALDGMERIIEQSFAKRNSPKVIRYADDLVVLHEDREVVEKCQRILSEWLKDMGLELKPSKTRIAHTLNKVDGTAGFDFLGFNIRQFPIGKSQSGKTNQGKKLGFKSIIFPSKEATKRQTENLSKTIRQLKAAEQEELIVALKPKIQGWANYYSTVCSKRIFRKMDDRLYSQLISWAKRRHPNKANGWIWNKYWQSSSIFAPKNSPKRLRKHSETPIKRHIKVKGNQSPYNGNWIYWSIRIGQYPTTTTRKATLIKKQVGKCLYCGLFFKDGELMEVDHIIPKEIGGKDAYYNWQLLHRHCHQAKTAQDRSGMYDKH